jgi:hypothetical protein
MTPEKKRWTGMPVGIESRPPADEMQSAIEEGRT